MPSSDSNAGRRYMAYVTNDKVGLQILPLDGNPHKSAGLIAHPHGVSISQRAAVYVCLVDLQLCLCVL